MMGWNQKRSTPISCFCYVLNFWYGCHFCKHISSGRIGKVPWNPRSRSHHPHGSGNSSTSIWSPKKRIFLNEFLSNERQEISEFSSHKQKKPVSQLQGGLLSPRDEDLILKKPQWFLKRCPKCLFVSRDLSLNCGLPLGWLLGGWWSFGPSWVVLSAPGEGSLLYLWLHCRWFWPGRRPGVFRCLGGQPVHPGEPVDRESTVILFYEGGRY